MFVLDIAIGVVMLGPGVVLFVARKAIKRRGRTPSTHLDEHAAHAAADRKVREVDAELRAEATGARRRREAPVTFREVAHAYLLWLEDVKVGSA